MLSLDADSRLLIVFRRRLEKSKFMVNEMLMMLSRLSMIPLRSLRFVLHLSLQFMPEVHWSSARLMGHSTSPSTRAMFAEFVTFAVLAVQRRD